jgi:DNA-binding transcriptional LysR family regulator
MLDVTKLATLREVVERGSFSAAAARLNLTQPAVSRQVALLEAALGVQLVRRTRQGVFATEAGRRLSEHAAAIVARIATAEADIRALSGLMAGRVRIGMFFTAFAMLAPEVDAHAEQRHPQLELDYELVDRRAAFTRLLSAELDLAVVFEHPSEPQPPPSGIDVTPLFDDPAMVLLPARHRLAGRVTLTLAELAGDRWIRPSDGSAARLLDHLLPSRPTLAAGQGDEPVEMQVHVAAGAGLALGHELNVLVNPAKIAVRPLIDAPPRRIQLARPRELHAPATDAIAQLIRDLR